MQWCNAHACCRCIVVSVVRSVPTEYRMRPRMSKMVRSVPDRYTGIGSWTPLTTLEKLGTRVMTYSQLADPCKAFCRASNRLPLSYKYWSTCIHTLQAFFFVEKYPRSLLYGGDEEEDFLYCLPNNKKIDVCREMMDNMSYPKFELGLSLMLKDHLTDNMAYNSQKFCACDFV